MIATFALLKSNDLKNLLPELTLFLFPVGGLEAHGPHLPVGTKLFQAESDVREIANRLEARLSSWNFILMPLLPFSVDSNTNHLALNVRPHVMRDAVVDQCAELARHGYRNFAVFSSALSPKQLTTLEDAAKIINRKKIWGGVGGNLISVGGSFIDPKTVFQSPMIACPAEHAGEYDTSFWLKENDKIVAADYPSLPAIAKPRASARRFFSYLRKEIDGYWGNPAGASADLFEKSRNEKMNILVEKMIPWLEKGKGQSLFRSGYAYYPFNGSFFKAYMLATVFFVMMIVWIVMGMRDVFEM